MQYLEITKDLSLSDLSAIVGERNVDSVLNANNLDRSVNIGAEFSKRNRQFLADNPGDVDYQSKIQILNQFVGDSDLFEKAALGTEDDWKLLSQYSCFSDAIRIPIEVKLPESEGVLGNDDAILDALYDRCMGEIKDSETHTISPDTFSQYSISTEVSAVGITSSGARSGADSFEWFAIPWGEVSLYSSIDGDMLQFPVYPEELDDGVSANYDEMPEMLYQYEPWKVYKSSGPREITFTFEFHRDMWSGDHRDGGANDLIRGCEANCYPQYDGSLVNVPWVALYIHGENYITGVMTSCKTHWKGPIGLDGFYLMCELSFTIVEVSPEELNYVSVRSKRLIQ
jgi:hypothetical protein